MHGEKLLELSGGRVVYLAHQRLSILGLGEEGRQPMLDRAGEAWTVYNGEVYNYLELATHMQLPSRPSSDTEVVVEKLQRNGIPSLQEFNGMWALAWVRPQDGVLYLARDRAGIKPLYTAVSEGDLYFASEVKTILALLGRRHKLNLQVVGEYLVQALQDTSTSTFFEGIESFPSGCFARVDLHRSDAVLEYESYWDPFRCSKTLGASSDITASVRDIVRDAVDIRLRADVPVGVLLSGGLDSSVISACASRSAGNAGGKIVALSAVSPGKPGDESYFIDKVTDYLKIDTVKVNTGWEPSEAIELLRRVTWANDSPLGSFSNIAFYLLMQRASEVGVKVVLSGQGGDELFCGYRKYLGFYIQEMIRQKQFGKLAKTLWEYGGRGGILRQFNMREAGRYLKMASKGTILGASVLGNYEPRTVGHASEGIAWRQWLDYRHFSVPFLTHYEDRASMAFGREVRLPLLDYRLVELMLNAPIQTKLNSGWTKWSLREAFVGELPSEIVWRRDKQGFSMPQEEWLRGELKDVWLSILSPQANVFQRGLIDYDVLHTKFKDFCNGSRHVWYRDIFSPLALEIWLQEYSEFIS